MTQPFDIGFNKLYKAAMPIHKANITVVATLNFARKPSIVENRFYLQVTLTQTLSTA